MIQASSSLNVIDTSSGKLLVGMRFSGLPAALEYLSQANLICSACGKYFGKRSTVTMMNRHSNWEIMFPHHCCSSLQTAQDEIALHAVPR